MTRPSSIAGLLFVFTLLLAGCSSHRNTEVLAILKTGTYHRPTCPLVNMAKTVPMTVSEARKEHLKPCPDCKPDTI